VRWDRRELGCTRRLEAGIGCSWRCSKPVPPDKRPCRNARRIAGKRLLRARSLPLRPHSVARLATRRPAAPPAGQPAERRPAAPPTEPSSRARPMADRRR
jgi:hypothetical protein